MTIPLAFERLKQAVVARTGHHYYADKDKQLYDRVRERMLVRKVGSIADYLELLELGEPAEWRALEDAITIGETYFFRYPDHFDALRTAILPGLIRARSDSRTLRIWSVGCSNGAEPYSVAIVLRQLLGDAVDDWRIALVGGDISEKALAAARMGRFTSWTLRTMEQEERAQYFDQEGNTWVLRPEYRRMVRFERQNILDILSPAPPMEWSGFDLILCRNVLIYFSPEQAVEITAALKARLHSDGALILGHAEATLSSGSFLPAHIPSEFRQALAMSTPAYVPPQLPPMPSVLPTLAPPRPANDSQPASDDGIAAIQRLADAGDYEAAARLCREQIAGSPMSARLHYYDAVLRQVSDDITGAETALRRAIYLDRRFVAAHHRLGLLLLSLGRVGEARRSLATAVQFVDEAQPDAVLPESQGIAARDFGAAIRRQIDVLRAAG